MPENFRKPPRKCWSLLPRANPSFDAQITLVIIYRERLGSNGFGSYSNSGM